LLAPSASVPAATRVGPVKVLAPLSVKVVVPCLVRPPVPLMTPEKKDPTKKKPLPPKLKSLLVVVFVFAVASVADTFLLVRARELGVQDALLPIVWVVLHFAKVVASSQVSKLPWRGVSVVVVAWVCVAVGFAAAAVDSVVVVALAVVVVGVGHGAREPTEKALVRRLADKDADAHRKLAMSLTRPSWPNTAMFRNARF
jgi:hypothetical protein